MMRTLPMLSALSLLTLADLAHAQSGPAGFQSPSKNIACQYFDYDKQNSLRCDISAMETKPRRPADNTSVMKHSTFRGRARSPHVIRVDD